MPVRLPQRLLTTGAAATVCMTTLTGCGISRPEPLTVEPEFSYAEQTTDAKRASAWPVDRPNLAEASQNRTE